MGYVSVDIRNLGSHVLCDLVHDDPLAVVVDRFRCSLPDPDSVDLACLVSAAGQHLIYCGSSAVKTAYPSPWRRRRIVGRLMHQFHPHLSLSILNHIEFLCCTPGKIDNPLVRAMGSSLPIALSARGSSACEPRLTACASVSCRNPRRSTCQEPKELHQPLS